MDIRIQNGMTEFIPTPAEKRESVIRDNVFDLLELLHGRIAVLEIESEISSKSAEKFKAVMQRILAEEKGVKQITCGE